MQVRAITPSSREIITIFGAIVDKNDDLFFHMATWFENNNYPLVNLTNKEGDTLLYFALLQGYQNIDDGRRLVRIIFYLLNFYEEKNCSFSNDKNNKYLLMNAVKWNHPDIVKRIVERFDPLSFIDNLQQLSTSYNKTDKQDYNALMYSFNKSPIILCYLLDKMNKLCTVKQVQEVLKFQNSNKETLLGIACASKNVKLVKYILDIFNKDPKLTTAKSTLLKEELAADEKGKEKVKEDTELLKEELAANEKGKEKVKEDTEEDKKKLGKPYIDYTILSKQGDQSMTPLMIAAQNNNFEILEYLLSYLAEKPEDITPQGINIVNSSDREGMTALHYACKHMDAKGIILLVSYGASFAMLDVGHNHPLKFFRNNISEQTKIIERIKLVTQLATEGFFIGLDLPYDFFIILKSIANDAKGNLLLTAQSIKQGYFDSKEDSQQFQGLFLVGTCFDGVQMHQENFITDPKEATTCFAKLKEENREKILMNCFRLLKHNSILSVERKKQVEAFYYPCITVFKGLTYSLAKKFLLNKTIPKNFFFGYDTQKRIYPAFSSFQDRQVKTVPESLMSEFLPYLTRESLMEASKESENESFYFEKRRRLQIIINNLIKEVVDLRAEIPGCLACCNLNLYNYLSILLFISYNIIATIFMIWMINATDKAISSSKNEEVPNIVVSSISGASFAFFFDMIIASVLRHSFTTLRTDDFRKVDRLLHDLNDFLNQHEADFEPSSKELIAEIKNGLNELSTVCVVITSYDDVKNVLENKFEKPLRSLYRDCVQHNPSLFARIAENAHEDQQLFEIGNDQEYDEKIGDIEEGIFEEDIPLLRMKK